MQVKSMQMRQYLETTSFELLVAWMTCAVGLFTASNSAANPQERPNILIVVVDDMGFSDLGCYGGEIDTPNIDRLAANGIRFSQFYNCSRCCQTRASLLTGAYPHRVGMKEFGRTMDLNVPTLAETLCEHGYATGMVGKWHLSQLPATKDESKRIQWMNHNLDLAIPFANEASYPTRRGFEKFYGAIWGVVDHFDPFSLTNGEKPVAGVPEDFYFTDAISQCSAEYISEFSRTSAPFFLYVAYTAPHWPIQARPGDIAKYANRYSGGWNAMRKERFARQVSLGLFPQNTPLGEISGENHPWELLSQSERDYQAHKMAVHAAMVDRIDQGVGQIVEELRTTGQLENTLILFLSDNGASPEIPDGPGYDRHGSTRDGRAALRDHKLRQENNRDKLGTDESYTGIGPSWASATNTPLRYWKAESFEGGCRTPMIAHWPSGIKPPLAEFHDELGHVIDIAPTCYEIAGTKTPNKTIQDGVSLASLLQGEQATLEARSIYFEHHGGSGIRRDRWKASRLAGKKWELFDIETDPGETRDQSKTNPDTLKLLIKDWKHWNQDFM